jgi:hypothetical protein
MAEADALVPRNPLARCIWTARRHEIARTNQLAAVNGKRGATESKDAVDATHAN